MGGRSTKDLVDFTAAESMQQVINPSSNRWYYSSWMSVGDGSERFFQWGLFGRKVQSTDERQVAVVRFRTYFKKGLGASGGGS